MFFKGPGQFFDLIRMGQGHIHQEGLPLEEAQKCQATKGVACAMPVESGFQEVSLDIDSKSGPLQDHSNELHPKQTSRKMATATLEPKGNVIGVWIGGAQGVGDRKMIAKTEMKMKIIF